MKNLYVIRVFNKEGKSLIKLGYSSNIKKRISSYLSHNPLTEVVGLYYRKDAKQFEKAFHKTHKSPIGREFYEEEFLSVIESSIKDLNYSFSSFNVSSKDEWKVFTNTFPILYGENLSPTTPRVFWWILDKFQGITSDFSITRKLKEDCMVKADVSLRTVDAALKELSDEELLIKKGRATFMINPKFVWKGNIRDRQKYLSIEILEDK